MKNEHSTTIIIISVVGLLVLILLIMKPRINISGGATNSGFQNPFNSYQSGFTPITNVPVVVPVMTQSADPNVNGYMGNEPTFTGPNTPNVEVR
jgi:hypothetical protein